MFSPLYWSFLMGGVNSATLKGTGWQTPPLMCKLVSLASAQCAITSDFCGFLLSAVTELVLLFAGLWSGFCVSLQKREWLQLPFWPEWGTCPLLVPPAECGKGQRGVGVTGNGWRQAQVQGALAVRWFWIVAQGNAGRTPGKIPQIPLTQWCNPSLTVWPGVCKTPLTPPFLAPAVAGKCRPKC